MLEILTHKYTHTHTHSQQLRNTLSIKKHKMDKTVPKYVPNNSSIIISSTCYGVLAHRWSDVLHHGSVINIDY